MAIVAPCSELDTAMSPLETEGDVAISPESYVHRGENHARVLDLLQEMGADRSCFARHELTSMNYCSRLLQLAIVADKSVIGKSRCSLPVRNPESCNE